MALISPFSRDAISRTAPHDCLLRRHDREAFFPSQSTAEVETISLFFRKLLE
jgi:hypothetical protein